MKKVSGLLLIAFVLVDAPAACAEPLSIEEIVTLKSVAAVELAPDGRRIAYIVDVPREPYADADGASYRELHVTDLDGDSRPFITGDVRVREVEWAIDGESVYYLAERGDDEEVALYEIPIDGGESRRIYAHATAMQGLTAAPDGRTLAFRAVAEPPERADELAEKGFRAVVYEESARPTEVWMLDIATEEPAATKHALPGSASSLAFSRDGRFYLVALAPTPLVDDAYVSRALHVVEAGTGRVVRRIDHAGKLGSFAWSPDGRRIAFVGTGDVNDPLEGRAFVATVDGESVRNLSADYPGHVEGVAWLDDSTLRYLGAHGLWTELERLDIDGSTPLPPAPEGGPIVVDFDFEPGADALALIAETAAHPREVYAWDEARGYRRLTRLNPILDERDLAPQEAVTYRTRDGLTIEAVLIRPLEPRRRGPRPAVIAVHGGPESHYRHGWMSGYTFPAQAMAAEGYAFLYPNYRASTGRGVAFSKLDHGDPAGAEFDDLVDGKGWLVENGFADADRVGISGGSYGGYATMWAATALTEHFAAGVAFVGISDLVSKVGTTDIPHEMNLVHWRGWPWEDWQFYLERSPIYHADKARTPLLILGGDDDSRVHPSQSLSLYRHMKLRTDTPVRLVQYPGEGHGNARTAARLDYALRMQRWMNHYLLGPGGDPPPHAIDHASRLRAAGDDEGE